MFRKIFRILGILLLVSFIIGTLAFTTRESKNIPCKDIQISFNSHDIIQVNSKEILRQVNKVDNQVKKKTLEQIDTESIEKEVEKIKAIEKVEVYKIISKDTSSFKGVLVVKVKHRKPFVRIITESENYFLDKMGNKIPSSSDYTANVLVVTGSVSEKFAIEELLPFVKYVEKDDFWKAQIEQLHVEKDGDLLIIPQVGDHILEMGSLDGFESKLRKMEAFYDQILIRDNWDKYKTISLKYNNQVVAKRN